MKSHVVPLPRDRETRLWRDSKVLSVPFAHTTALPVVRSGDKNWKATFWWGL